MNQKKKSKLTVTSIIFIILGCICLVMKRFYPPVVDNQGILVEPMFFLLPIGFALIFVGILVGAISFIKYLSKK